MSDELNRFIRGAREEMYGGQSVLSPAAQAAEIERAVEGFAMPPISAPVEPDPEPTDDVAAPVSFAPPTEPDRTDAAEARIAVAAWVEGLAPEERDAIARDPDLSDEPFYGWLRERVAPEEADRLMNAARWTAEQPSYAEAVGTALAEPAFAAALLADPEGHGLSAEQAADWLVFSATASEAEWGEYCASTGWDRGLRPARGQLPAEVEMRLVRESLERRGEATFYDGRPRYFGE